MRPTQPGFRTDPPQTDLFQGPTLPGLAYRPDFLSEAGESALIRDIDAVALEPFRFQGWTGKRLTASFGWRYDFDTARFNRAAPIPDFLLPLRAHAAAFAGLPAEEFVQALLIRYDPGAGIGWHRDRPVFEHVVGISLGHAVTMRFRRRKASGGFERHAQFLERRSAYHLNGPARHDWEHSIAPVDATRWSVTFRSLSARGRGFL